MKTKPKNPYTELLKAICGFIFALRNRQKTTMFFWKKEILTPANTWRLDEVYQRALAAKTLGYEVIIEADESGMTFKYRSPEPKPDWQWT